MREGISFFGHAARRSVVSLVAAGALALLACSAGTSEHPSPPTNGEYDIQFPSTAAAVGADTIQVFVFDKTSETTCANLLVMQQSGGTLPATLAKTDSLPICDVLMGTKGKLENVTYGDRVFLVIAQRQGKAYFSGCALTTVSATSMPVVITMNNATVTPIPQTTCTSVTQFCTQNPACTVM